jgi:predicted Zn-dependent protease
LVYGESREQGVTRGRQFFHEPLGFALTAPAGWRVRNGRDAVLLVNPAGDAGLALQPAPPGSGRTHEEILRNTLKPTTGRTERRVINGFDATHFVGQRQDAQGRSQGLAATIVTGPEGRHHVMLHASRDAAALQRAQAGLREAESSFRALSDADRAAARPWTLTTVPWPRGGFDELARRSPLGEDAETQLRLINGLYPRGEPRAGQRVKVVR